MLTCPRCSAPLPVPPGPFCVSCGAPTPPPTPPGFQQGPPAYVPAASYQPPAFTQPAFTQPGFAQSQFPQPGYPQGGMQMGMSGAGAPPNYLAFAIISTILCCWPVGLFSILQAVKVDRLAGLGDFAGAQYASQQAKKLAIAAVCSSAVLLVAYLAFLLIVGVSTASHDSTFTPSPS